MYRIARVALLVAVAASTAFPVRAAHGPGCEAAWSGTNRTTTCPFALRGVPLMLSGQAYTQSGTASVTVTASLLLPDGEHVLAVCTHSAARAASCSAEWSPLQDPVDPFVTSAPLVCRVRGTSTHPDVKGSYGCFSWQS